MISIFSEYDALLLNELAPDVAEDGREPEVVDEVSEVLVVAPLIPSSESYAESDFYGSTTFLRLPLS